MAEVAELEDCRAEISAENYLPRRPRGGASGGRGGGMDDILKRLGVVESSVAEIRVQVSAIVAVMPHLATKADIGEVRCEISSLRADMQAEIGALRTDTKAEAGCLRAEINALETRIIKWIIATVIATAGLAFSIAKFVH